MAGLANIVFGYAGTPLSRDGAPIIDVIQSEALATSEASSSATTATAPAAAQRNGRDMTARIYLSETGWVWKGASPTANKTTTGIKLAANTELYIALNPGDKVAVLDDA